MAIGYKTVGNERSDRSSARRGQYKANESVLGKPAGLFSGRSGNGRASAMLDHAWSDAGFGQGTTDKEYGFRPREHTASVQTFLLSAAHTDPGDLVGIYLFAYVTEHLDQGCTWRITGRELSASSRRTTKSCSESRTAIRSGSHGATGNGSATGCRYIDDCHLELGRGMDGIRHSSASLRSSSGKTAARSSAALVPAGAVLQPPAQHWAGSS